MLSDKFSLIFSGIVGIGFFIAGLANLLDNIIVQLILGMLFLLIIINLFVVKKTDEGDTE